MESVRQERHRLRHRIRHTASDVHDLKNPGLIGAVEYSDEPISSFLSTYGASSFFRKRTQYSFEAEWRSVRALSRFSNIVNPANDPALYLARFNPACTKEILTLRECSIQWELSTLSAIDARYRHTAVTLLDLSGCIDIDSNHENQSAFPSGLTDGPPDISARHPRWPCSLDSPFQLRADWAENHSRGLWLCQG